MTSTSNLSYANYLCLLCVCWLHMVLKSRKDFVAGFYCWTTQVTCICRRMEDCGHDYEGFGNEGDVYRRTWVEFSSPFQFLSAEGPVSVLFLRLLINRRPKSWKYRRGPWSIRKLSTAPSIDENQTKEIKCTETETSVSHTFFLSLVNFITFIVTTTTAYYTRKRTDRKNFDHLRLVP